MLSLGHIKQRPKILFDLYADDTQLYLPVKPTEITNLASLTNCLANIKKINVSMSLIKFR